MQTTLSEVAITQSNQEFLNYHKGDTVILQSLIFGLACTEVLGLCVVIKRSGLGSAKDYITINYLLNLLGLHSLELKR